MASQPKAPSTMADFHAVLAVAEELVAAEKLEKKRDKKTAKARKQLRERLERFRATHVGTEINVKASVGGVVLTPDGTFETTILGSFVPAFEWLPVSAQIYELERLAEEAREWWPRPAEGAERQPHSMKAFGLTTWVLKAAVEEQKLENRKSKDLSAEGVAKLAQVKEQLALARERFAEARQRSAQTRYWRGALLGAVGLTLFCGALGYVFWLTGTLAFYGVAVPAGGLGAMVSVLQRMSSGRMQLDTSASRGQLVLLGTVRPLIGAIFGIVLFAAIQGGLVTAFKIPVGQSLAFFAVIGFLAGFNERWAQDMLKSTGDSIQPLSAKAADANAVPAAAAGLAK